MNTDQQYNVTQIVNILLNVYYKIHCGVDI